ncbi:hypothetical protein [Neomegalonema perideroedes]|uniref:hypothetical protein n=1 Tax=Neomegalonema perideroedes TaxID=217219 RepID=UPI0003656A8B|nr:hypothetical protein [Neomegalonema perideroedes]
MNKKTLAAVAALLAAPFAAPGYAQTAPEQTVVFSLAAKVAPSCRFTTSDTSSRVRFSGTADFGTLTSTYQGGGTSVTKLAQIKTLNLNGLNPAADHGDSYAFFVYCNPGAAAHLTYNRGTHLITDGGDTAAKRIPYSALVKVGGSEEFVNKVDGDTTTITGADMAVAANRAIALKFQISNFLDYNGSVTKQVGDYADTFTISLAGQ